MGLRRWLTAAEQEEVYIMFLRSKFPTSLHSNFRDDGTLSHPLDGREWFVRLFNRSQRDP